MSGVTSVDTPNATTPPLLERSPEPQRPLLARIVSHPAFARVASVAVVLGLWQLIGTHFPFQTSFPSAVLNAGIDTFSSEIVPAFSYTIETFGLGLAICVVIGVPLGLALERSRLFSLIAEPYFVMLFSVPFIALFPVLILQFGVSFWLRVACVVLAGLFPVILNTASGAREVDATYLDVGRSFVAERARTLTGILLPASVRFIFAGIRIGFARGMIGAIVVELEASAVGVGSLLMRYIQQFQIANFFAALILLGFFALLCTIAINQAEIWCVEPWERRSKRRPRTRSITRQRLAERLGDILWGPLVLARTVMRQVSTAYAFVTKPFVSMFGRPTVAWTVRILTLVAIITVWEVRSHSVSRAVLPSPSAVATAAYNQIFTNHELLEPLLSSFTVLFLGFALSLIIGIPIGIAMGRWRVAERIIDPYISLVYALPHVTFVPIMIVWLGFGMEFRVAYVVVSAIFPVIINTMSGVKSVDPELVATARGFCASERKILRSVVIPGAIPLTLTGARIAFSASWVGVVISEILSTNTGLGGLITEYSDQFKTADMFVPIIMIMIIAVALLEASTRIEKRLMPWSRRASH